MKKRFFINAAVLSAASVTVQTIGVSFNVYISNKIGAAGVGLYGLIMSVYVFAVTLAASGVNLAATRLVAEFLATNEKKAASAAARACLLYGLCFGSLSAAVMYTLSGFAAYTLLGDARTATALRVLSVSLPFVGMSSAASGYFVAVRRVAKSASSQLFEQAVRICAVVIFLKYFTRGETEQSCVAIVAGGSLAEICSFLYLYLLFRHDRKKHGITGSDRGARAAGRLFGIALPVALSAYVRSALTTTEHILIPRGLKKSGASSEAALSLYGVIHGMVMPLLLFPSAFIYAFSGMLIPEITECARLGRTRQIHHIMGRVYRAAFAFSVGVCGIFMAFSAELGEVIYKSSEAGGYIYLIAPLVIAMYADSVTDALLKGLGEQVFSMKINITDSALSVILVLLLLPKYGIGGYVAVIFAGELINTLLSLGRLIYITDFKIQLWDWLIKPALAALAAAVAVRALLPGGSGIPALCLRIFLVIAVYIALLLLIKKRRDDSSSSHVNFK